jgi:hypothetical protein
MKSLKYRCKKYTPRLCVNFFAKPSRPLGRNFMAYIKEHRVYKGEIALRLQSIGRGSRDGRPRLAFMGSDGAHLVAGLAPLNEGINGFLVRIFLWPLLGWDEMVVGAQWTRAVRADKTYGLERGGLGSDLKAKTG